MRTCTPVIAGRVPEKLYRQIKQAAKRSGRTMSGEMAWLIGMAFEYQAALGGKLRIQLIDPVTLASNNLERLSGGPNTDKAPNTARTIAVAPDAQETLERTIERVLRRLLAEKEW